MMGVPGGLRPGWYHQWPGEQGRQESWRHGVLDIKKSQEKFWVLKCELHMNRSTNLGIEKYTYPKKFSEWFSEPREAEAGDTEAETWSFVMSRAMAVTSDGQRKY